MFKHINEALPPLTEYRPDLPPEVNAVIRKATAKNPAERYADVSSMIGDLQQALGIAPLTAAWPPHTSGGATPTPSRGRTSYETGIIYLPTVSEPPDARVYDNPYKGLRAFQEADAADFFGRETLVEGLLERLRETGELSRFLAVVGPSGSGKSSVVRAGLIPAIKRGALPNSQNWYVLEMFPNAHPIDELAQALLRIAVDPPNNLVEPLALDEHGLLRVVDRVVPGGDETEVVLLIDQFEELFTLVEDEAARTHFLNSLITAVTDPYSRIRVIVTLRADFYDRPLLYPGFSELMRQRTEVVVPLSAEELKEAIVSPAERAGLRVDPELVEAIVADVGEQPGALPLLQYALTEVFERRQGRVLTLTPYQASGGVLGALARRAEEIYTGLAPAEQEIARQLFLRLVTLGEGVEDTRRRVRRSELIPAGSSAQALDAVIGVYSQYRLLTGDRDPITRAPTVEVAHEALIRTWQRLRQWLDASRDDLRQQRRISAAAAEWAASGRERSFLASGARLEQLESWSNETHLALNAEEQEYLKASLAERDAQHAAEQVRAAREKALEQRSKTFLRALVGGASAAAVLGLLLAIFAFSQRSQAFQNAKLAEQNAQQATLNEQQAQQNAQQALQSANAAATAEANAQVNADRASNLALTQGAQAAFNQGNLDLAGELALRAAEQPNSSLRAEQVLATVAYNPSTRMVLNGHTDVINSVVYSPDETMALSGGRNDKIAILWDLKTGSEIRRFVGHPGRLREVAFLPDGKRVLTASEDGTVRLWDVSCASASATECDQPTRIFTDTVSFAARPKGFEVKGIAVRPGRNQFITANSDFTLKLWDIDCASPSAQVCETPTRIFAAGNGGHTQEANLVTFSPDGSRALSSSEDTSIVLWDVETGAPLRRMLDPNNAEVRGVAILPGGRIGLSGGAAGELDKWDLETGQLLDRLRGHKGTIYNVAVNVDGSQAITGGADNSVIVWDLEKNVPATVLRGHGGYIRQAVFSKDGKFALSGSQDKTIRLWDLFNGAEDLRLKSNTQINSVSVSADGGTIATGDDGSEVRIWDGKTGKLRASYTWHEREVTAVALSPDASFVLSGGGKADGALIMTDLKSGSIVPRFNFRTFNINAIAFTPDGKQVVTAQGIPGGDDISDGRVSNLDLLNISLILWDVASGEPVWKVTDVMVDEQRRDSINSVAISPDGSKIYGSTGAGSKILIFDRATGKQIGNLDLEKDGKATQLAMTPDGKFLAAGTSNKVFIVWDLASGDRVWRSPEQPAQINAVAITANGRYVAASAESEVAIWDLQSGEKIRSFIGHARVIDQLAFVDGDKRLVSGSADGTTRVWRFETREEIIAWVKANRHYPELDCDQAKLYSLPCN